jgi:hypothetical protein
MVYIKEAEQLTNTKGFSMDMSWLGEATMNWQAAVVLIVLVGALSIAVGVPVWASVIKKRPSRGAGMFNRLGQDSQLPDVVRARKERECCKCDCHKAC